MLMRVTLSIYFPFSKYCLVCYELVRYTNLCLQKNIEILNIQFSEFQKYTHLCNLHVYNI